MQDLTSAREPKAPPPHGAETLPGLRVVPRSPFFEGRFGRMFRSLVAVTHSYEELEELAGEMVDRDVDPAGDNLKIGAGYTYLGQFIDHDITYDPASQLQRSNDPDALKNFRTPRFDLDSVYASGPADSPALYEWEDKDFAGVKLLLDESRSDTPDLIRNDQERAVIGDPRNDENVIVSQLHLAFIKFHNAVADRVAAKGDVPQSELFKETRRIVQWHYQWIVVHDFLKKIVGPEVVHDILRHAPAKGQEEGDTEEKRDGAYIVWANGGAVPVECPDIRLRFYAWRNTPFMPVEFSVAAYRFGHSIVRPEYRLKSRGRLRPIFGKEGEDLRGFRRSKLTVDWSQFFGSTPQWSRKIDTKLAEPLHKLPFPSGGPDDPQSLALRNLLRGRSLGLPSGQDVAKAMNLSDELMPAPERLGFVAGSPLYGSTPLWYYILKEAEELAGGERLGPVGGRIVAEVLLGLLKGDKSSFFSVSPGWVPDLEVNGNTPREEFSMVHLLKFAGVA